MAGRSRPRHARGEVSGGDGVRGSGAVPEPAGVAAAHPSRARAQPGASRMRRKTSWRECSTGWPTSGWSMTPLTPQAYVRTGVGVRRRGTRSLRAELRGRGVAPEVIDLAAQEVDEDDERATALALARRRAPGMARLAPEVRRRRLMGLLLRRGFNGSIDQRRARGGARRTSRRGRRRLREPR